MTFGTMLQQLFELVQWLLALGVSFLCAKCVQSMDWNDPKEKGDEHSSTRDLEPTLIELPLNRNSSMDAINQEESTVTGAFESIRDEIQGLKEELQKLRMSLKATLKEAGYKKNLNEALSATCLLWHR